MMKKQLFGSSWCTSAIHLLHLILSVRQQLQYMCTSEYNYNICVHLNHQKLQYFAEIWRDFYFPSSKILVFNVIIVNGVNVLLRNKIIIFEAVSQIPHISIYSGTIFIASVVITIGLQKVTISRTDLYSLLIYWNQLLFFILLYLLFITFSLVLLPIWRMLTSDWMSWCNN